MTMNKNVEYTAIDNLEVSAMLKRADAFLPYRPSFCLQELKGLKELNLLKEPKDKASSYLIETKAYINIDEFDQALQSLKKGLKINEDDDVLNFELKMHKAYILGLKKKKRIEKSNEELLVLGLEFRELEETELAAKSDLYYAKLLVVNGEYKQALSTLKRIYWAVSYTHLTLPTICSV